MKGFKFEDFNISLMNNVVEAFKEPLKEWLDLIKTTNIYSVNAISKFLVDLKEHRLEIKTEPVAVSANHVAKELDNESYGYGYIDMGRDSILYNGKNKKKIVIWREVKQDASKELILKVLAYLIDRYLFIDEAGVKQNYTFFADGIKQHRDFEYTMLTGIGNCDRIGGFSLTILDKWCGFFECAISDIVSSYITRYPYLFKRRAEFFLTAMRINSIDLFELQKKREASDINYFYSIIPEQYAKSIGLFSILYINIPKEKIAKSKLFKLNLQNSIYKYICYLFSAGIMDKFSEDMIEEFLSDLYKVADCFYNPDEKVDFRESIG